MGKSIVHCVDCGKAIREDDFAGGKASIIDDKNYCSACRPVAPSTRRALALDLRKGSSTRMPKVSVTPRGGTPVVRGNSRTPIIIGGSLLAVALAVLVGFLLSGKRSPDPVEPPTKSPAAIAAKPVVVPKQSAPAPETPATDVKPSDPLPKPGPEPEAKPVAAEKIPPPIPRLTDPLDGSNIDASADIPLEAEARDPQGRIARVEFWQGATKLGETVDVPYRFTWKAPRPSGTYELKAKTIDREGTESSSEIVRVTIKPAPEPEASVPAAETPAPAAEAAKAPPDRKPELKKDPLPQVDQKKLELAIKKGIQYLTAQVGKIPTSTSDDPNRSSHCHELVLWTFVHAGVPESTPSFRYLFKTVTEAEIRRTYEVSLQAMILEELDRVRYQERLQQCAQFLVDNECPNGQWGYGDPASKDVPTMYGALPVPTGTRPGADRQKPLVTKKLKVTPRRTGPRDGDNSNSQYAALGIRACSDAGIVFPDDGLTRARNWFRNAQHNPEGAGAGGVATGPEGSAAPRGWCYAGKGWGHEHVAYGSMTAGSIGALAIYDTLLGEDWRKDGSVASGISWLARNFSVTGNPGPPSEEWCKNDTKWCHFYYLYALERAGVLCRTEWFGKHAWYGEGANALLASQGKDGSWNASLLDTCFAILFLKRVTRPLEDIASMDERPRK